MGIDETESFGGKSILRSLKNDACTGPYNFSKQSI